MTAILVILTILVAVALDVCLVRRRHRAPLGRVLPMGEPAIPSGLFLSPYHLWLRLTSGGTLRLGLDDFLSQAVGEVQRIELPPVGSAVKKGEPLVALTFGGRRLVLPSPVEGEVVGLNAQATQEPWLLSRDPYGAGWLVSLWCRDLRGGLQSLAVGVQAGAWLREQFRAFADFLSSVASPTPVMADGGLPRQGVLASLDDRAWELFCQWFLAERGN